MEFYPVVYCIPRDREFSHTFLYFLSFIHFLYTFLSYFLFLLHFLHCSSFHTCALGFCPFISLVMSAVGPMRMRAGSSGTASVSQSDIILYRMLVSETFKKFRIEWLLKNEIFVLAKHLFQRLQRKWRSCAFCNDTKQLGTHFEWKQFKFESWANTAVYFFVFHGFNWNSLKGMVLLSC